jgi:TrmH family RNA methyltransferase
MFARHTQATAPVLLTSPHNPILKDIRRAVAKGTLTGSGYAIAEGLHVVEEAIRSRAEVKAVIVAESLSEDTLKFSGQELLRVPDSLFDAMSSTDTPQGAMALVRPCEWTLDELLTGNPLVVVLDGVQDPGNAGGIVRSAEAFGATGVLLLKGSVFPYNPKAIRASAGSVFRLPLLHGMESETAIGAMDSVQLYAAMPRAGSAVMETDLTAPCALIIGSEGSGVNAAMAAKARPIRIPTGDVESLNAGVAAAILIYEASRQRGYR